MAVDPTFAMILAERGCPFEEGTVDATVWIMGWEACRKRAKDEVARVFREQATATVRDAPVVIQWQSTKPRKGQLN